MKLKNRLNQMEYQMLLTRSIIMPENPARLVHKLSNEKLKLAFLGASITLGYTSKDFLTYCFPNMVQDYLIQTLKKECEIINLGIGGVSSIMGLFQVKEILEDYEPDLIFLDYSITEEKTSAGAKRFESLVKQVLSLPTHPAVINITTFTESGYSCKEFMDLITTHYTIPSISMYEALHPCLCNNSIEWNDFYVDNAHPSYDGHEVIADCIITLLNRALYSLECTEEKKDFPVYFGLPFYEFHIYDFPELPVSSLGFCRNTISYYHFTKEMMHDARKTNEPITLTLHCRSLALIFIQSNDSSYGNAYYELDHKEKQILQGYSIFGWENPVTKILLQSEEANDHTLSIQMEKGEEHKLFRLVSIGYS